jgi:hypothetical protein
MSQTQTRFQLTQIDTANAVSQNAYFLTRTDASLGMKPAILKVIEFQLETLNDSIWERYGINEGRCEIFAQVVSRIRKCLMLLQDTAFASNRDAEGGNFCDVLKYETHRLALIMRKTRNV